MGKLRLAKGGGELDSKGVPAGVESIIQMLSSKFEDRQAKMLAEEEALDRELRWLRARNHATAVLAAHPTPDRVAKYTRVLQQLEE